MLTNAIEVHLPLQPDRSDPEADLLEILASYRYRVCSPSTKRELRYDVWQWAVRHQHPIVPPVFFYGAHGANVWVGPLTHEGFVQVVGREPEQDDLHRVNCHLAGEVGHF